MKLNFKVLQFALPLIFSNLTVPLLGFINTVLVGHLAHSYYLGAVGLGVMIFNIIYLSAGVLRMGTTGLIAQAHGAHDAQKIYNIISHSMVMALSIGILLISFQIPIERIAFLLIGGNAMIQHYTHSYYIIRIWGAPAMLLNYVLLGTFIGIRKPTFPLWMMLIINVIAILLGVLFIKAWEMAAQGVALADVIAQYLGCCFGVYYLYNILYEHKHLLPRRLTLTMFTQLFVANRDIFIRTLSLLLAFAFFTVQSTKLGITILAVNTILTNFQLIMAYGLDGFANAAEFLVGKSIGEKNHANFIQALRDTSAWIFVVALLFIVIYAFFGKWLIDLMTDLVMIQTKAYDYLPFVVVAPLLACWCFWLDGVFIGAGQFHLMRNTMLLSLTAYIITWYLLRSLGNTGLWIALLSLFTFRSLSMFIVLIVLDKKKIF
jgi:MATE family multidrug resistance protein